MGNRRTGDTISLTKGCAVYVILGAMPAAALAAYGVSHAVA